MATAPTTAPTAPPDKKRIAPIKGKLKAPWRAFIYGPGGVGKSTLLADTEAPIFIDCEDGTGHLDVERYRWRDGLDGHVPRTFQEILDALTEIGTSPDYAHVKTLAIVGMGTLERLLWAHMLERDSTRGGMVNESKRKLKTIEDYGYNKGPTIALDLWTDFLAALDRCRAARGCNVILEGHSIVRNFKNPAGEDYGRISLAINEKAAGLFIQAFEVIGYLSFEEWADTGNDGKQRARGSGSGRRVLRTERSPVIDAKSRWPIPDDLEITEERPWGAVARAIAEGQGATPQVIGTQIMAELDRISDQNLSAQVKAACSKAKDDVMLLGRYLNSLRKRTAMPASPPPQTTDDTPSQS